MAPIVTTPRLMAVGGGALAELPGILQRLGLANPLIVTDPFLAGSGHLDRATAYLDRAGIPWTVFSDTVADPTTAVVETGAESMRHSWASTEPVRRQVSHTLRHERQSFAPAISLCAISTMRGSKAMRPQRSQLE